MTDMTLIRDEFPAVKRLFGGRPVVYLDSAATYLKPRVVIDAVTACYRELAGTIGRGVHLMAEEASAHYEDSRAAIADFINADADEIVFVRNATEAMNMVAASLEPGTEVLGSVGEHHSNLLPWRRFHRFHSLRLLSDGRIRLEAVAEQLAERRPRLVAVSTISNAFGAVQPVAAIVKLAHDVDADVLLDANQSVTHYPIDVRKMDCDYLCFSGHKLGGPTGVGVLYARRDRLEKLRPMLLGGGMVDSVSVTGEVLADLPMRLEAGTPAFEGVIGLAAACEFLASIGWEAIGEHERRLTVRLIDSLRALPRVTVRGPDDIYDRGAIVSFHVDGLEAHGVARMLSGRSNLCVRSGFHCSQPAHETLGFRPTVRASFGVYNTEAEVDLLIGALGQITANLN